MQNDIEVQRLDSVELRRREPNVTGLGALFVPATAIVDYRQVCAAMARVIQSAGGEIVLGARVTDISETEQAVTVRAGTRTVTAGRLVACAGLQSDRLASLAGLPVTHQIVPFRGEYYRLPSEKNGIVRSLIYPIPDPDLPFLGIHLTRMIDGGVTVGPNAVLGFAREGYRKLSIHPRDVVAVPVLPRALESSRALPQICPRGAGRLAVQVGVPEGVPQVLSEPRSVRSASVRSGDPRPGRDPRRHPGARFPLSRVPAHAPRLQRTVTGGDECDTDWGDDCGARGAR